VSIKEKGAGASNADPEQLNDVNRSTTDADSVAKRDGEIKEEHRGDIGRRVMGVRRKNVERVARHRYAGVLKIPDDRDGRIIIQLLLELGLDGVSAQHIAPWCTGEKLEDMIRRAQSTYAAWSKKEVDGLTIKERIGARIEVTFDEYKLLGLTHVWPCDAQRHEVEDFVRQRRAARELHRKRRKRALLAKQAKPCTADPWDLPNGRAKALALTALRDGQWWPVRALTEHAREELGAFEGLDYKAARQAVLRAIKELKDLGIVETKTPIEARGLKVLYARRPNISPIDETEIIDITGITACEEDDDLESDRGRPLRSAAAESTEQAASEE
jgi:hypothetical protein